MKESEAAALIKSAVESLHADYKIFVPRRVKTRANQYDAYFTIVVKQDDKNAELFRKLMHLIVTSRTIDLQRSDVTFDDKKNLLVEVFTMKASVEP